MGGRQRMRGVKPEGEGRKETAGGGKGQPASGPAINYKATVGCSESARSGMRNKGRQVVLGSEDNIRREKKLVRIGDEAELRHESREEMTGRRAALKREAQKCCRRRRQSSRAKAVDFIGSSKGLRERERVRLPMCKEQM